MASKHKLKEAYVCFIKKNKIHLKFHLNHEFLPIFRFEVESEYGAIYTGGLVKWTSDAEKIYCQDQDKINIISVADNKVKVQPPSN